eukprot:TRINITY_DN8238_c0_g1_i1.p1 TRINITY_DN8238_c0_g1~~TRINITY_DN8238_c0_g1_i1.p1  ORF type:complete len:503 (+),score=113.11 TRINITY_DN8238_c0_g1_i1:57-1565(+)
MFFLALKWTIISFVIWFLWSKVFLFALRVMFYKDQGLKFDYIFPFIGFPRLIFANVKRKINPFNDLIQKVMTEPDAKVFTTHVGSDIMLILLDPQLIKDFFTTNKDNYSRSTHILDSFRVFVPHGIFCLEAEDHKRHRRALAPLFHFDNLRGTIPMLNGIVDSHVRQLMIGTGERKRIDILKVFQALAGEVSARMFIGKDAIYDGILQRKILEATEQMRDSWSHPLILLFGARLLKLGFTKDQRDMMKNIRWTKQFTQGIIDEKKKNPSQEASGLIEHLSSKEVGLSDKEIIDEFISFIAAGTDTTTHLLTMCIYFILTQPLPVTKLLLEIHSQFPYVEGADIPYVSLEQLNEMNYLNAFIKEVLRLYPPTPMLLPVEANQDHKLGEITVKKGTNVNVPICALGYNPKYFKDPLEFRPERWLEEEESSKIDPFVHIAFSAGARNCLGQYLAKIEAKMILVKLLSVFTFKFSDPKYDLQIDFAFMQGPKDPLLVDLEIISQHV